MQLCHQGKYGDNRWALGMIQQHNFLHMLIKATVDDIETRKFALFLRYFETRKNICIFHFGQHIGFLRNFGSYPTHSEIQETHRIAVSSTTTSILVSDSDDNLRL